MNLVKTKIAAAAALTLAFSSVNAATISGDTLLVNIVKDGLAGNSMLIDTNISTDAVRTGALTSWSANTDLVSAIDLFIGASTDVRFYVAGFTNVNFDKWAFSNKTQLNSGSVGQMQTQFQSFVNNANNEFTGNFMAGTEGLTENWKTNIPDGDVLHYDNNFLFGNGFVVSSEAGTPATMYSSQSGFFLGQIDVTYNDWNLDLDGNLSYGVSAVPVPAAAWLMGTGLLGLVGVARRRKA